MLPFRKHILDNLPYKGGSVRDASVKYKLSSNENPLGTSPLALKAISNHLTRLHEYQFQDDGEFTEKLSRFFHFVLSPEQFLPANSGMELIDIICRGFLEPDTSAIISTPTFMAYRNAILLAGANVIDVPLNPEDFSLNAAGILAAVDAKTRLVFVANPGNPTGSLYARRIIDELVEGLPSHVVLVYDEVYHQFADDDEYPRALEYITAGKNVIGMHSFSKAYGLAALRLGYLFSTPEIAGYLRHLRRPFMISSLSMEAGMAALDDNDHLAKTTKLIRIEKAWLYRQFAELGIHFWPSAANFILIRPHNDAAVLDSALREAGIMVRSAAVMGAPGCLRITIGTRTMNSALIAVLKNHLVKKPGLRVFSTGYKKPRL